jgi:hypothetical protein
MNATVVKQATAYAGNRAARTLLAGAVVLAVIVVALHFVRCWWGAA